jgi:hypothetical protein
VSARRPFCQRREFFIILAYIKLPTLRGERGERGERSAGSGAAQPKVKEYALNPGDSSTVNVPGSDVERCKTV